MIYQNEHLNEISFPLGGIGTGSIGLAGNGELIDWEIFNRPNKCSLNPYTHFAIRAEYPDGRVDVRVLQGEHTKQLIGQYGQAKFNAYGFGPHGGTMCAFPHFRGVTFDGRFPVAALTFSDDDFPAEVVMTAYNPMIPHEADDSSLPVALFDITVNSRIAGVRYSVVLSLNNPFARTVNEHTGKGNIASVTLRHAGLTADDRDYGDLTAAVVCREETLAQRYWYRSDWQQDFIETFWQELTRGSLCDRDYAEAGKPLRGRGDIGSVGTTATAHDGEVLTFSFALAWNVPNCYNYWDPCRDADGRDITWKNYYATRFADSVETAHYALTDRERLWKGTKTFRDVLHGSSLDPAVIDAAASNLSVLKTSTVLRLEDGTFWAWEGVHEREGSCQGTCTHVWSYAYAMCLLYPELERSIRETEFKYDTDADGRMGFRTQLPLGRGAWTFRACLDGQMASVIKTLREWKISGDDGWLRTHWETVKALIAYAWSENNPDRWDADRDGVLEGRQHHTLDMEMFGPSGWLEGMYLAALRAAEEMARYLGDDMADEYRRLYESGYAYTKRELFNGEYFIQKVDLADRTPTETFHSPEYWNEEAHQLKYQIGEGCEIDQLLGQWHAVLCGLGEVFDAEQRKTALRSMMRYIYKPTMREFINTWRVFALGDEGGAVMCDYPATVERPVIPIPYSTECMTGFEYAFAGLLISEGMIDEGLTVVRAVRDRYDGKKRNPYNEIECGSNYARSMASFALLPIFSGFEFDLPHGHIGFSPLAEGDFRSLWSVGKAWGGYERTASGVMLTVCGGLLKLSSLRLGGIGAVKSMTCDGRELSFEQRGDTLRFEACEIQSALEIRI